MILIVRDALGRFTKRVSALKCRPYPKFRRRWSAAEVEVLKRMYLNSPDDEIATAIGRSTHAVASKAGELGFLSRKAPCFKRARALAIIAASGKK